MHFISLLDKLSYKKVRNSPLPRERQQNKLFYIGFNSFKKLEIWYIKQFYLPKL